MATQALQGHDLAILVGHGKAWSRGSNFEHLFSSGDMACRCDKPSARTVTDPRPGQAIQEIAWTSL